MNLFVQRYMHQRFKIQGAQTTEQTAKNILTIVFSFDNINGKYYEFSNKGIKEAKSSKETYNLEIAKRLGR